jgi:LPS-assembly protein
VRAAAFFSLAFSLGAQTYRPALPPPPAPFAPAADPNQPLLVPRPDIPDRQTQIIQCAPHAGDCSQESDGPVTHLRGRSRILTSDLELLADEIDYNNDTRIADVRGHVEFQNFLQGEKLNCDHAIFNVETHTGKFYEVSGSEPFQVAARPGLLTSTTPLYFQAEWAERFTDHYVMHNGFVTDCVVPNAWWILKAPEFDVYPHQKAVAHKAWFYVRKVRLFYLPRFNKSLEKYPRRSGLLTPNIGNSSLKGMTVGAGFYWAINRSYDLLYRAEYYSNVGVGHNFDIRGKVSDRTDFNLHLDALNDNATNPSIAQGGYLLLFDGRSQLGKGWEARGQLHLLSSFAYRQEFSESINEAIFSETHSVGYLTKHWSDFAVNLISERDVNFQTTAPGDNIQLRKLPEVEFLTREHELRDLPIWVSLDSSDGLERRSQPLFQTRQFVERADFIPRLTTAFHFWGVHVSPSFGIRETFYDSSFNSSGQVTGDNLLRSSRDVGMDILLPSLERVFNARGWLGKKVKHVIEPRVTYKYVTGINDFNSIIRFDENDLVSNTYQVEFSLANRLLSKDANGTVTDLLTWQLRYQRYFDPTFGGAIVPGQRNVIETLADLTGYSFLNGIRRQSPVVSELRFQSKIGMEWRADYDPVRHGFTNSSFTADGRVGKVAISAGETFLKTDPVLAPSSNQLRASFTYGIPNRRGLNFGGSVFYDLRQGVMQYSLTQVTYNTDCCGLSVQYRRFSIGLRDENQYLLSFAISNIATFGTLKKQERLF